MTLKPYFSQSWRLLKDRDRMTRTLQGNCCCETAESCADDDDVQLNALALVRQWGLRGFEKLQTIAWIAWSLEI